MFAIWKKMKSMAQAYITIKKTWCKQSLGSSLWTSFLLCVTMWKCFRTASSPSAALPRARQTWSSSGTGGGELGFPSILSIWSETLIYVDALQWSETTAWSTSLWPTGSWRKLCITSRLVIMFDLLSAWSSSWSLQWSKIGSLWFQNDDHQSTVADRVAVLTVASARNIDSGVFRCSVRLPGAYTAKLERWSRSVFYRVPTSLEITLWSSLVFIRCVVVDSGLRVERSLSPPLRILDPPKVVDCQAQLFYIWIFV